MNSVLSTTPQSALCVVWPEEEKENDKKKPAPEKEQEKQVKIHPHHSVMS